MDKLKAVLESIGICLFEKQPTDEFLTSVEDEKFLIDVYKLAKKHDVAHYVGYALAKTGFKNTSASVFKVLEKEQFSAVYRHENIAHELEKITRLFEKNEIDSIVLKGSYIRRLYVEGWMRTSCDIDILCDNEKIEKAIGLLKKEYGYECRGKNKHDYQLYSPNGVHLELHFRLIEDDYVIEAEKMVEKVWDYTVPLDDQKHIFRMNDDMLYYYNAIHTAKHIIVGGCGIKPIIDTYILNRHLKFTPRKEELFDKGGIKKFDELICKLSRVWFGGESSDETVDRLSEYIIFGGVYGNVENRIAASQDDNGGKVGYALNRIFLPYNKMVARYPELEKHKWLYPFYQFRRWFDVLFGGRVAFSLHELKANQAMSAEKKDKTEALFVDLGLK